MKLNAFIIVIFLVSLTSVHAQRSRGIYTVPNTAFVPDLNIGYKSGNAGDGIAGGEGGTAARLVAPVYLPHGVILDSARIYFVDYADEDMYITMLSYDNTGAGVKDIFLNTTNGKSSAVRSQKALFSSINIDNEKNSYSLMIAPKTGWGAVYARLGIRSVVFYYH